MNREEIVEQVMSLLKVAIGQVTTGKSEILSAATSMMKLLASIPLLKKTIDLFREKPKTFEAALKDLISDELKQSKDIENKIIKILSTVPTSDNSKEIRAEITNSSNVAFAADSATASVNINNK